MLTRRRSSNQSGQAIPFLRMPQKAQSGNMSVVGAFLAEILGYLSLPPIILPPRFVNRRLFLYDKQQLHRNNYSATESGYTTSRHARFARSTKSLLPGRWNTYLRRSYRPL